MDVFNTRKLGAYGAELSILASFFDPPWLQPVAGLNNTYKGYILNEAGYDLRTMGRLRDAAQPIKAGLEYAILQDSWRDAATCSDNLTTLYLTAGDLGQALAYSRQGVEFADLSQHDYTRTLMRAALANVLHQIGDLSDAEDTFREAEELQKKVVAEPPCLFALRGFQYCDLLLGNGKYGETQFRATQSLKWAIQYGALIYIALGQLSLGQTYLLQALGEGTGNFGQAMDYMDQALSGLREAGTIDFLPLGLLARAGLYRVESNFGLAQVDLDEALNLAVRSSMDLYQADCHLEYSRLYLAQREMEKARHSWEKAKEMIERMGYQRRDKDVNEIEQQLGEAAK